MKKLVVVILCLSMLFCMRVTVYAHPGRTDSSGGHTNNSTGEYHFHHGYSAHDHYDMDGDGIIDCPYNFHDSKEENNKSIEESPLDYTKPAKKGELNGLIIVLILIVSICMLPFIGYVLSEILNWILGLFS